MRNQEGLITILVTCLYLMHYRRLYQKKMKTKRTKGADIHPELTLDQVQNPQEKRRGVLNSFGSRSSRESRGSRRSSELSFSMTEVLELNTMYEFGQEKKRHHRRSRPRKREGDTLFLGLTDFCYQQDYNLFSFSLFNSLLFVARRSTWEGGIRRSSMSVMTMTVKKTEKRQKKYFPHSGLKPQSRTAVHYLVLYLKQF